MFNHIKIQINMLCLPGTEEEKARFCNGRIKEFIISLLSYETKSCYVGTNSIYGNTYIHSYTTIDLTSELLF